MNRLFVASLVAAAFALAATGCSSATDDASSSSARADGASDSVFLAPLASGGSYETPLARNVCASVQGDAVFCGSTLGGTAAANSIYFCSGGQTYTEIACPGSCEPERTDVDRTVGQSHADIVRGFCTGRPDQHVRVSSVDQELRAYEGDREVKRHKISTGMPGEATWKPADSSREVFQFGLSNRMELTAYPDHSGGWTPNVPWNVYLGHNEYFHSAIWSWSVPGVPSGVPNGGRGDCGHCGHAQQGPDGDDYGFSAGCINHRVEDARWMFLWTPRSAPIGFVQVERIPFSQWCDASGCHDSSQGNAAPGVTPSCYSNTLGENVDQDVWVKSNYDGAFYQCASDGSWAHDTDASAFLHPCGAYDSCFASADRGLATDNANGEAGPTPMCANEGVKMIGTDLHKAWSCTSNGKGTSWK